MNHNINEGKDTMEITDRKKSAYALADDLYRFLKMSILTDEQASTVAQTMSKLARDYVEASTTLRNEYKRIAELALREADVIDQGNRPSNWISSTANAIAENHVQLRTIEDALRQNAVMLESVFQIQSLGTINVFEYLNY